MIRSCKTCIFFRILVPFSGNVPQSEPCEKALASWYPQRGYAACPKYIPAPLTDDDY